MSTISPAIPSTSRLRTFHRRLGQWYGQHGRKDLPWRLTDSAYAIYVSEIMLQQTQVATVQARYYFPFLERFPTLQALADADRKDVLKVWQGLGYYNRAANLHEAAKRTKGILPDTVEALMALPGIGRNTAHAVAALAYRQKLAVMEANVRRVLSRIFALKTPDEERLWEYAHALLDKGDPFTYNQAMMDIGAMVCKKRAPLCESCPANTMCIGKSAPESYPAAKIKKTVPVRQKTIVVLHNGKGEYYAEPRKGKFLNGLYHFMEMDLSFPRKRGQHKIPAFAGMTKIGGIRQQYSHFTLDADVFLAQTKKSSGKHWYGFAALKKLPMSMAEQKILALLEMQISARKRA